MKLAEALTERADKNRRLQELRERIVRNAQHQEDETPAEDPNELLEEYRAASSDFERLIVRVNTTNNQVTLEDGRDDGRGAGSPGRVKTEPLAL